MLLKNKMLKQKKLVLFFILIIFTILTFNIISAQICNVEDTKSILKKALFDYLPNPELSKLNSTEIKDLLNFYLNSSNLTTVKCDVKATLSHIDYEIIIDKFNNYTVNIKIPYCEDGTHYNNCSSTKPLYCASGILINNCTSCGCLNEQVCLTNETCVIPKTISNLSDGSSEKNITFNESGNQTIYFEVPLDVNVTKATIDVTPTINTSLDIGTDGDIDVAFNDTNTTQTTPDLSPEINKYIINEIDQSQTSNITGQVIYRDSGKVFVPLTFYSESAGTIKISNININYVTLPSSIEEPSFFEKILAFIKHMFT